MKPAVKKGFIIGGVVLTLGIAAVLIYRGRKGSGSILGGGASAPSAPSFPNFKIGDYVWARKTRNIVTHSVAGFSVYATRSGGLGYFCGTKTLTDAQKNEVGHTAIFANAVGADNQTVVLISSQPNCAGGAQAVIGMGTDLYAAPKPPNYG